MAILLPVQHMLTEDVVVKQAVPSVDECIQELSALHFLKPN